MTWMPFEYRYNTEDYLELVHISKYAHQDAEAPLSCPSTLDTHSCTLPFS